MNGVVGLAELLLDTPLSKQQREYVQGIQYSSGALLRIIGDILDFSKIEAGKLEFESVEFDVRRLVESTLKAAGLGARSKDLELVSDISPDVPERVLGDPARLRQVLVNLTGNAVKFTDRGEVVVHADRAPHDGDTVELHFRIEDTGIGIPLEKRQQIFSPITQ